jgi:primosomal protein N' (replication factor Y)
VAGRAGRSAVHGRAIIQTFMPEHYSIVCAMKHDYQRFYEKEIRTRQNLGYPPFGRIVNIRFSGVKKGEVEQAAQKLARFARSRAGSMTGITVLGPVQSPKARIKSRYRFQLILKGEIKSVRMLSGEIDRQLGSLVPSKIRVEMDVDPLNFM